MPRWLVASFIAFLLSCIGFAAVAHSSANSLDRGEAQLTQPHQPQHQLSAVGDEPVNDSEDGSALQDEANSGSPEAATGGLQPFVAVTASQPVPQPATTARPSPFLAQPKRPPRDHAFTL